jgi:soluble lytic murein transglycosylase-like protein
MLPPKRALGAAAISTALLSGVLLGGTSPAAASVASAPERATGAVAPAARSVVLRLTVTVVAGDSAYRIARRHGVALQDLLQLNRISAKAALRPGMVLRVPPIVISAALAARLPRSLLARPERLRLVAVFQATARSVGVPPDLLMALAYRESNWNAQALSRSGAMGIGQLMPATIAYVTTRLLKSPAPLDPWDPADNIWMSGRTLRNLLDLSGGDPVRALAAYYQGFGSLTRQGILPVGQRYADSILAQRASFRAG